MSRFLHRLGRGAALHPWRTLGAWVLAAGIVFGLAGAYGGTPVDNWDVPGAPAQRGVDQLRAHVPGAGNASAQVVVHGDDGRRPTDTELAALTDRLLAMDHAVAVTPPRISEDGDTAMMVVSYDEPVTHPDLYENLEPLEDAVTDTRDAGLQVEFGGDLPGTAAAPMDGYGEIIGIVAALLILLLAFGSVVGAGLPIGVALVGLVVGSGGLTLLAATMDVSTAAPMVASMVGLGVGIDYALLLLTRHVEYLRQGYDVPEAAGRAAATAGRSVVFASATVLVSLLGLRLAGLSTYSSFGFATAIAVVTVAAAALTLVPVFSRFAGRRLLPRKVRKGRESTKAAADRPLGAAGRQPPAAVGDRRRAADDRDRAARPGHAHLAAGRQQPVDRDDHASGVRPGVGGVRQGRQRPPHRGPRPLRGLRRARSSGSPRTSRPVTTSSRSPRRSSAPTARSASSRRSRPSAPPTSAPSASSGRSGRRCPRAAS